MPPYSIIPTAMNCLRSNFIRRARLKRVMRRHTATGWCMALVLIDQIRSEKSSGSRFMKALSGLTVRLSTGVAVKGPPTRCSDTVKRCSDTVKHGELADSVRNPLLFERELK